MVLLPIVYEDIFIWRHGTEDYHHMKALNPKTGEDLWVIDMAGHFLVDYGMVGDTLYALRKMFFYIPILKAIFYECRFAVDGFVLFILLSG